MSTSGVLSSQSWRTTRNSGAVLRARASLTSVIFGLVPKRTGGPHVPYPRSRRPTCAPPARARRRAVRAPGARRASKAPTAPRARDPTAGGRSRCALRAVRASGCAQAGGNRRLAHRRARSPAIQEFSESRTGLAPSVPPFVANETPAAAASTRTRRAEAVPLGELQSSGHSQRKLAASSMLPRPA
jgi:hypothetical protein